MTGKYLGKREDEECSTMINEMGAMNSNCQRNVSRLLSTLHLARQVLILGRDEIFAFLISNKASAS